MYKTVLYFFWDKADKYEYKPSLYHTYAGEAMSVLSFETSILLGF